MEALLKLIVTGFKNSIEILKIELQILTRCSQVSSDFQPIERLI